MGDTMKKTLTLILLVLLTANLAPAAVLRVPSQYPDIHAAVNAAVEGDTVLIADGIYSGERNRNIEFTGQNIVIMSENGPYECVIDLDKLGRAFYIHRYETNATVIEGLTICNGMTFTSGVYRNQGAGILIDRASPTIRNCIFQEDSARG